MTSAAEAKLDARIRPDIAVMRSRTPYPKRHRPVSASAGEAGQVPSSSSDEAGANAATGQSASAALAAVAGDAVAGDAVAGDAVAGDAVAADTVAPDLARPDVVKLDAGQRGTGQSAGVRTGAAAAAVGRPVVARPRSARPVTSGTAARPAPIRLTRRGRMVMGFLAVIVAVIAAGLAWLVVATHAQASSHVGPGQVAGSSLTRVVVRPGQSLWSIASREDPTADPREVIQQIIDANSLGGTGIRVGQVIWVPRG